MDGKMIPIFKPYMPENIQNGINEILYSGSLSYGKYGKLFEERLTSFIGCDNLLTVSSYNQAILIVLSTLGLLPGDEVIASPVSCLASNQPFVTRGLKVIWADINPQTGSLCVDDVRSKISVNTKAIFHNHFCGFLGDVNSINDLGKEFGIPVIDDCVEAFGSEYNNLKSGNFGTDISIFSFHTVRLPNTIDGGALVFKNVDLFEKAKKIRDHGIDRSNFRDDLNEINPKCDVTSEGYGALMSEFNSYIGFLQMEQLDKLIKIQRKNALAWSKKIKKYDGNKPLILSENTNPNFWVYGILSKNKIKTIKEFRKLGYYATGVHVNNNIYSVFKNKINLKGVDDFMSKFVALPSGWWFNVNI
tara:strand:+ start:637 stop:1716 length:1080 start_codon:yes stop_codon:yes gene_type:complete